MSGSTLEAMSEAVENAAVVLICLSERYKQSPNCRTGMNIKEYLMNLHKIYSLTDLEMYSSHLSLLNVNCGTERLIVVCHHDNVAHIL